MDTWVVSTLWLLGRVLLWTFKFFYGHVFLILLGVPLGDELLGSDGNSVFHVLRTHQAVFHGSCTICTATSKVLGFQFLHILTDTCYFLFLFIFFKL